jgi:hypothetical protein
MTKKCPACKQKLSIGSFWPNKSKYDGLCSECKNCQKKRINKWRKTTSGKASRKREYEQQRNSGKVLAQELKRKYNLSVAEYNKIFQKQQGCCAICGVHQSELKKRLFVDHNHRTEKVRGLLCCGCNNLLAGFDNLDFFNGAIAYLAEADE